jgi:Cdc6-like AAA superfamily ATPase
MWPDMVNVAPMVARMAKLHDGREVDTRSEEWRAECEARRVLGMASKSARHAYLANVAKRRGEDARVALQALVMAVWRAEREQDEKSSLGY